MRRYVKATISTDLEKQIELMQKKIKEIFGIEISKVKASKLVAHKSRISNLSITEKELIKILGDGI
ncbi:MAG: hypothetical protein ACTSPV_01170 [Candidatus Hodarchaeales archaeon]